MSAYNANKPENALKRANELVKINELDPALLLLHDILIAKRYKTWSLTYEEIMLRYLQLCISSLKNREVKDGLHQYRNMCQTAAPGSLEKVILYLIKESEVIVENARGALADGSGKESIMSDLETPLSPETLLLQSMSPPTTSPSSSPSSKLLPSLKFLWEVYRSILDILRTNTRLEKLYHSTCASAFKFCLKFSRKTEFRRLSDMLRTHLSHLQKYGSTASKGLLNIPDINAGKLKGWEGWTSDSIELHLGTRFMQLDVANRLEQHSESFRTIEDIHSLLQISQNARLQSTSKSSKSKIMAQYYSKLVSIFWRGENVVLSSYAYYKYFTLCNEFNRGMGEGERTALCKGVLVSSLCIPETTVKSSSNGGGVGDKEKNSKMASLLGFNSNPTKVALLRELKNKKLLSFVPKDVVKLFNILEDTGDVLTFVERVKPLIDSVTSPSSSDVAVNDLISIDKFKTPLEQIAVHKLLTSLSKVYSTISISSFMGLLKPMDNVGFLDVEKMVHHFIEHAGLRLRIDMKVGVIVFTEDSVNVDDDSGSSSLDALSTLAQELNNVVLQIKPNDAAAVNEKRGVFFEMIKSHVKDEHSSVLARRVEIEKRKEEYEKSLHEKQRVEDTKKQEELKLRKIEEQARLAKEAKLREREKYTKIQDEIDNQKKKLLLNKLGRDSEGLTNKELKSVDANALAKEHRERGEKKKDDLEKKMVDQARRLDYVTRALRIEEISIIVERREKEIKFDNDRYALELNTRQRTAKAKWEVDFEGRKTYENLGVFKFMAGWHGKIEEDRGVLFKEECRVAEALAVTEAEEAKVMRAKKKKAEEVTRLRELEERREIEEEEERINIEKERIEKEEREEIEGRESKERAARLEKESWIQAPSKQRILPQQQEAPQPTLASGMMGPKTSGLTGLEDKFSAAFKKSTGPGERPRFNLRGEGGGGGGGASQPPPPPTSNGRWN